ATCSLKENYSILRVYSDFSSCESFPATDVNSRTFKDYIVVTDQCLVINTSSSSSSVITMLNTCDETNAALLVYTYNNDACSGDPVTTQSYGGCQSAADQFFYFELMQCNTRSLFTSAQSSDSKHFPAWAIAVIVVVAIACFACSYLVARTSRQMGECLPDTNTETLKFNNTEFSNSANDTLAYGLTALLNIVLLSFRSVKKKTVSLVSFVIADSLSRDYCSVLSRETRPNLCIVFFLANILIRFLVLFFSSHKKREWKKKSKKGISTSSILLNEYLKIFFCELYEINNSA
ncbi:hypothetical protein RFI_31604, partial [Reticulomyxa filosa]